MTGDTIKTNFDASGDARTDWGDFDTSIKNATTGGGLTTLDHEEEFASLVTNIAGDIIAQLQVGGLWPEQSFDEDIRRISIQFDTNTELLDMSRVTVTDSVATERFKSEEIVVRVKT